MHIINSQSLRKNYVLYVKYMNNKILLKYMYV